MLCVLSSVTYVEIIHLEFFSTRFYFQFKNHFIQTLRFDCKRTDGKLIKTNKNTLDNFIVTYMLLSLLYIN